MIKSLVAVLALGVATVTSAQTYTVGNTSDSQSLDSLGQSFTPSLSGFGFSPAPTGLSYVTLNAMAFSQWHSAAIPTSLYIVPTAVLTDAPDFSAMIDAICADPQSYILGESSGPTTAAGLINGDFPDTYITSSYTFTNLTLAANTSYTALFSNAPASIRSIGNADAYLGGALLGNDEFGSQFEPDYDAVFSVTLTPSAIPEPSTYAALAGLLAVAGVWVARRRHA
jgi:hypothetical protein